jgi:hypothetical protein
MNYPCKNIAITLSPKPQHNLRPLQQYDLYTPKVWNILMKYEDYFARPELTLSGLIHFHVYLKIQSQEEMIQWQRSGLPSLKAIGNTKVKLITEGTEDQWTEYINKEKDIYDKIFINRETNLRPNTCPTTKELKILIGNGISKPLDEGINNILTQYKIKLNNSHDES